MGSGSSDMWEWWLLPVGSGGCYLWGVAAVTFFYLFLLSNDHIRVSPGLPVIYVTCGEWWQWPVGSGALHVGSGGCDLWGKVAVACGGVVAVTCGEWQQWPVGSGGCYLWGMAAVTCGEWWL